jgi:mono/diheme cytochrome c family protein
MTRSSIHPAVLSVGLVLGTGAAGAGETDDPVARGAYLARIMVCADCHSPRGPDGAPMPEAGLIGGNVGFEIPGAGIVWGPNLTAAGEGAGSWTTEEIVVAITSGVRPDGRELMPIMPWPAYAGLTESDALALAAYLQSLEPVENAVPALIPHKAEALAPYFTVKLPG